MEDFALVAIAMRSVRLYAFVLTLAIMWCWGSSLWRIVRGRAPQSSLVAPETPEQVGLTRERTRATWAVAAFGIFLIQIRWLTPWLPPIASMRIWLAGISIVDGVLLAAIIQHGRADPRFELRRTSLIWASVFALCVLFAIVSA